MNNSIEQDSKIYVPGDWTAHRQHGIGRYEGVEVKGIGRQTKAYCKMQTHNIPIWLPVDKMNDEWLRPLASPADVQQALEVLKSPSRPMSDNLNSRKRRIKEVDSNDAPTVIAELLRDLWAIKKVKKTLSQAEESTLRHFTDCFLAEWSVSLNVTIEGARQEFEELLQIGQEQPTDKMRS